MRKILFILMLVLLIAIPAMAQTPEEMLAELNTPENVQLVSKTLDNNVLLSDFSPVISDEVRNILVNNDDFEFTINGTEYYFVKYQGIFNSCSDCKDTPGFDISERGLTFVYNNKAHIIQVMRDGKADFFTKIELMFSAIIS